MNHRQLLIIGAGGHGKVAADIARQVGYTDVAFLDDHPNDSLRVVGTTADIETYATEADFFVAIGNATVRKNFFDRLKACGATIVSLIHPHATIARSATLGEGVLVAAGAVVGVDAVVGDGAIVNTLASVDHDCGLGAFSHVSAGVHMAGTMQIDQFTFVGVGATVIQHVCSHCTIGAGAVVAKPITESGTYVGVPARKIK
jgi:sugar O-acyltransferase (sialic acid O-acetyltransferase NeuD family)